MAGREDGCAEEGGGEEAAGFAVLDKRRLGGEGLEERDGCEMGLEGACGVGRGGELVGETLETARSQLVDDCGVAVEHAYTTVGRPVDGVVHAECGVVGSCGMEVVCQRELCRHEFGGGEFPAGNERFEITRALGGRGCWHGGPPCLAVLPRTLVVGVVAVGVGRRGEVEEGDVAQAVYEACVWGGLARGGVRKKRLTAVGVLAPLADEFWPREGGCARGGGGGGGGPCTGGEGVGECEAVVRPLGSHRV